MIFLSSRLPVHFWGKSIHYPGDGRLGEPCSTDQRLRLRPLATIRSLPLLAIAPGVVFSRGRSTAAKRERADHPRDSARFQGSRRRNAGVARASQRCLRWQRVPGRLARRAPASWHGRRPRGDPRGTPRFHGGSAPRDNGRCRARSPPLRISIAGRPLVYGALARALGQFGQHPSRSHLCNASCARRQEARRRALPVDLVRPRPRSIRCLRR